MAGTGVDSLNLILQIPAIIYLTVQSSLADDASAKLREQIALIKAKENITVKEAALLLSCSESHIRKLVMLARKGKSSRPIPYVDVDGVRVFPLCALLDWATSKSQS